jgi:hypothetical protein
VQGNSLLPEGTDLGGGVAWMGTPPPLSLPEAKNRLLEMTGIPDLAQGVSSLGRGETLAGIGQGAFGALSAASLLSPDLRGAFEALRGGVEAMPALLGGAGAIRAWHGTPHLFPSEPGAPLGAFRDEAIGSGEGAQAYGWGHYVAGESKVAEKYREKLAGDYQISGFGDKWKAFRRWPSDDPAIDTSQEFKTREEAQNWVDSRGALLEVHVLPEEHELLDWDKGLGEQSPGVQENLKPFLDKIPEQAQASGGFIYKRISQNLGGFQPGTTLPMEGTSEKASKALHAAGIPGIKYLDEGSRRPSTPATYFDEMTEQQKMGLQIINDIGQKNRWLRDPQLIFQDIISDPFMSPSNKGLAERIGYMTPKVIERFEAVKSLNPDKLIPPKRTYNYVIFDPSNLRIIGRNRQRLEPVDYDPFEVK